ncbi:MAG: NADPH-dependent F420 reductase [gamma proteobacterium endosymbiont of Lamellibrachia anaximandri]|nr:NADPH-dependent F420 reductase [gamma proteobacterium endosymbiont of Lamellibrachia anaximandri]MBL3533456.1 NADPH-dependent F420 reductase [gamma proteobacterium endosymbiont of Lamellibrachia anaximandri]
MKIGILGTGGVGRVLGAGFAGRGHEVMIGTRDPAAQKVQDWLEQTGHDARAGTFAEAAAFGEVVVVAIGWPHLQNVIELAGAGNFAGKLVMDATNPLRFETEGQPPVLDVGHTDSAGELVQRLLPEARVVKAFNIVGNPHMVDPDFPEGKPDMFICGNDENAKKIAGGLIESLGWPPVIDLGGIENSRYLEPLAMVWIRHFFSQGFNGNHAFKLLRK